MEQQMTRSEKATRIVEALRGHPRLAGRVWAGGGRVRVYITNCGDDLGFVRFASAGAIEVVCRGNHASEIYAIAEKAMGETGDGGRR
jgi:hypothetical protein